ncbi:MAG: hypothetical protein IH586_22550 [Anaerolineaceae bacterium]|nr:hypothetical protein [Anaerolineaceae bacterium]
MKMRLQNWLVLLLVLILILFPSQAVLAVPGIPGSPDFGNGGVVYPNGPDVKEALAMAADLDLDWINLPIHWDQLQPNPEKPPLFTALDSLIEGSEMHGTAVMVSISDAPDWALTINGPDPEKSAAFVNALAGRYPGGLQAVELFPGANTRQAWEGQVSPQAYFQVFQAVAEGLRREHLSLQLVAAGLQPLPEIPLEGDIQDLVFLEGLYAQGAADWMPVISLQYPELTGEPMVLPTSQEERVFRHYEAVRNVMVKNQHYSGIIWITQISLPSGKIDVQDLQYLNSEAPQVVWLSQAYYLLRSQLYIGVAFIPSLNSNGEGAAAHVLSLIRGAGDYHPFYSVFRKITGRTQENSLEDKPGKHKEGSLEKKRPWF